MAPICAIEWLKSEVGSFTEIGLNRVGSQTEGQTACMVLSLSDFLGLYATYVYSAQEYMSVNSAIVWLQFLALLHRVALDFQQL